MHRVTVGLAAAIGLAWSSQACALGKPVIAIYEMDDLAHSGQAPALTTMIETAIENTSKFRVIEREHLANLVGEQAGAKSGLLTTNTPGKVGGFEGADFLIYGTITTVSVGAKADIGSNLMVGLLGGRTGAAPNCRTAYATIGLDIKITDAKSGEVRYVNHIDETQRSGTVCGAGRAQLDSATLMRSAGERVAAGLVTAIYPIEVAAVQPDGMIVLNYGEGSIQPGAIMALYAKGDVIRDPATGEVLANNETKIGLIRVTDVLGRISKAVPLSPLPYAPQVGTIARPASEADLQAAQAERRR